MNRGENVDAGVPLNEFEKAVYKGKGYRLTSVRERRARSPGSGLNKNLVMRKCRRNRVYLGRRQGRPGKLNGDEQSIRHKARGQSSPAY
jgi:hypothetical protein